MRVLLSSGDIVEEESDTESFNMDELREIKARKKTLRRERIRWREALSQCDDDSIDRLFDDVISAYVMGDVDEVNMKALILELKELHKEWYNVDGYIFPKSELGEYYEFLQRVRQDDTETEFTSSVVARAPGNDWYEQFVGGNGPSKLASLDRPFTGCNSRQLQFYSGALPDGVDYNNDEPDQKLYYECIEGMTRDKPSGLTNNGATCWFNAILQILLTNLDIRPSNRLEQLLQNILDNPQPVINPSQLRSEWLRMVSRPSTTFGMGQEDAHEGLLLLLDSMPCVEKLYRFHTRYTLSCRGCEQVLESRPVEESIVNIDLESNRPWEKQVACSLNHIEDAKCERCGAKKLTTASQLTSAPKNLIIMFPKYNGKINVQFPNEFTLEITRTRDCKKRARPLNITYELGGQVEHSGTRHGGHYYSVCRRGERVFYFNDAHVAKGELRPTDNTYLVLYIRT